MNKKKEEHYPVRRHFYIKPEDLPNWLTEDPGPEKKKPKRKRDTKALMRKMASGIISENSFNYYEGKDLITRESRIEYQRLTAQEKIIVDCLADKLMRKDDCYYLIKSEDWKDQKIPFAEFPWLLEDMRFLSKSGKREGSKFVGIMVTLNAKEIREMIGLRVPCWKIREWAWGLFNKAYLVKIDRIIGEDGKFVQYKVPAADKYLHFQEKIVGKLSKRKKIEEKHKDLVEFDFLLGMTERSKVFLRSLMMGQFTIFPKLFYKLKYRHQDFIRYLSVWAGYSWEKLRRHPIEDVKDLLGLKTRDVHALKLSIKRILDNLMKQGFIKQWKAYGRGWDTEYRIQVGFDKQLFEQHRHQIGEK